MISQNLKIVTDGLIFLYDRDNLKKGYVGAPATNLLAVTSDNVYTSLSTGNATYGPVSLITTPTPFGTTAYQTTFTTTGDNGYYGTNTCRFTSNSLSVSRDGTTIYKYSVWVWCDNRWSDWDNNVYKYVTGSNGMAAFSDSGQRAYDTWGREWRRYWMTGSTLSGGGTAGLYHTFYKNGTLSYNLNVLLCAPDFYADNYTGYVVPYVNGTRTTSQSVYDLTGNSVLTANNLNYTSDGLFTFNGSSSYISIPYNSIFDTTTGLTIESVVKFDTNSDDFIFEKGNVNTQYSLFSHSTDIVFRTYHSGDSGYHTQGPAKSTVGVTNGQWTHIVGSWDGSTKRIYINGVLKDSVAKTGALVTTALGSSIGRFGGTSSGYFFNGSIAKVAVYNKGLSDQEVLSNFNAIRGRYGL